MACTRILILLQILTLLPNLEAVPNDAKVGVNKCCAENEMYMGRYCVPVDNRTYTSWKPIFTSENRMSSNIHVSYKLITGAPDCGTREQFPIFEYKGSNDVMYLLPNGYLRHTFRHIVDELDNAQDHSTNFGHYDYEQGKYCIDKIVLDGDEKLYALVCSIENGYDWMNTDFFIKNILNPIIHMINIGCLAFVAIVYFIMPTLKDLVGNIISTIALCLIVSQSADLVRLITVISKNHISLIIAESVCYIALLGAFFWLNSLGYYIWKTFKARNMYLRITDGKKYCYYSAYAWSCTFFIGFLAIFLHYVLDYPTKKIEEEDQERIGSLGMIIFFMPIAITVLMNIFFLSTTVKLISRMNIFGRIHLKLKHRMFVLLFLIMTFTWIFFLLSFSQFNVLIYCYVIVSAIQAPVLLYVCIFNQKHVTRLIKKTCCYTDCCCSCCRPEPECDWSEEMTTMNVY